MKNLAIKQGVIFGVLITIFNLLYQHFVNDESGIAFYVASVIGGLVGGLVYGWITYRRLKKQQQHKSE